nr:unnamed protein product [Callosobruchus analis]
MSERLSLSAQDGALWNRHPSMSFSNISDVTIQDESYMTAMEAGDDTQYLSVISGDDDTFEEAQSIALNEQHIEDNTDNTLENTNETDQGQNEGEQVIVYSVEGSDELFGIQIAQDEEGNLQKYQFQYRATEDGQLEAMPETLTLLPSDDLDPDTSEEPYPMKIEGDIRVEEDCSNTSDDQDLQDINKITVKGEPDEEAFDIEPELADIKPDLQRLSIKQELGNETQVEDIVQISCQDIGDTELSALDVPNDQITILEYNRYNPESETDEQHTIENIIITHEDQSVYTEDNRTELDMYNLEHSHVDHKRSDHVQDGEEAGEDEQETESETFEAIEGTHITGDEEISLENFHIQVQEPIKSTNIENTKVAKDHVNYNKLQLKKNKPIYNCISEKENLNMISLYVTNQMSSQGVKPTHPRSLLKCDVESRVIENEKSSKQETRFGIVPNIKKPSQFGADLPSNADVVDKRFARNKEAMQAMMFDHFINKTTIPHAPVRHNRLPRKQQIKPVANRRDEEIIVQEVMVSAKGFVENSEERLRNTNQFRVTSVVELSDSDDDVIKKGGNQENHGVDSDNCIIEIKSDDELDKNGDNTDYAVGNETAQSEKEGEKKSRSRSPKSSSFTSDDRSPSKKSRTDSDPESESGKKEFDCPHCSKSFPSPNSLNTHIQHHNLENRLRKKELKFPRPEYKYKCDKCQESFKNAVLLNRHDCKGDGPNMLTCNLCLKKFKSAVSLSVHKKSHVKKNLLKNTSTLTVSPRKSIPRPSMGGVRQSLAPVLIYFSASISSSRNSFAIPRTFTATGRKSVIPKPVITVTKPAVSAASIVQPKNIKKPETFQCKDCPKVCLSQESLNLHEKYHKKIVCNSCKATFTSRLLLDSHVRFSCVKRIQSPKGRLSFKVRKSFVRTPKATTSNNVKRQPTTSSSTKTSAKCNLCNVTFSTLSALLEHEVKEHKFHTPDRSMVEIERPSSSLHKPVHGGVRPNQRFKTAFALFQTVAKSDSEDKGEP